MKINNNKKNIRIIIPCYNEEENITFLYNTLLKEEKKINLDKINIEYLFIDDGSTDKTFNIIKNISTSSKNKVKYIKLSRNFGKESVMIAGIENSLSLDAIIFIDADGQDIPGLIPQMIEQYLLGYNDVYAKRISREDKPFYKNYLAKIFYFIINKVSYIHIPANVGDYRLLDNKCISALYQLKEKNRYTKGLFSFIGYKKKALYFNRPDRKFGISHFKLKKQISFAINALLNFSPIVFYLSIFFSMIFFLLTITTGIMYKNIIFQDNINSIKFLIIFIFEISFTIFFSISSLIFKYLDLILEESKNRPSYFIESKKI